MKPSLLFVLLACAVVGLVRSAPAADAPAPLPSDVVLFAHGKVDAALTTGIGGALLVNNLYKVQVARRVAPAGVEIHTRDTDIFYILDGSATFLTGGTAVNPRESAPGEIRAKAMTGGTEHHLAKGDVIIIPQGIPHQFTAVNGPFLYFVVKVTQ